MREFKLSTKRGKRIYEMGKQCTNYNLINLYKMPSMSKVVAFERCWAEYCNDKYSISFGVGNQNSFGFTCSWLTTIDNESAMVVKTRSNDYLVWLER